MPAETPRNHGQFRVEVNSSATNIQPGILNTLRAYSDSLLIHRATYGEHIGNSHDRILNTARVALSQAPDRRNARALVLKPNSIYDVPIPQLVRNFGEVTVVGLDRKRMEEAAGELDPTLQKKVKLVVADASGVMTEFDEGIRGSMRKIPTPMTLPLDLSNSLISASTAVQNITVDGKSPALDGPYDFVCSHLAMSQLGNELINYANGLFLSTYNYLPDHNATGAGANLFDSFVEFTTELQLEHINYLRRLVSPTGTVHLADAYTRILVTPGVEGHISPIVREEVIAPQIEEVFDSIGKKPPKIWVWEADPRERLFEIKAHALRPKIAA